MNTFEYFFGLLVFRPPVTLPHVTFDSKTFVIEGAIKRDNANNTIMVPEPYFYWTAWDPITVAWQAQVEADDAHEALILEVSHDSVNNVRFSATIWATETRI